MQTEVLLKGEKAYLETFSEKHITQEYVDWLRSKPINSLLIHSADDVSLEEVRDYCHSLMESKDNIFLAIVSSEDEKHIGNVRLGPIDFDTRKCSFGMLIGDINYHGKGIGTEVVKLCIDYVFKELNMHRFYLGVWNDNYAAIRIYEKNNFETEGILKDDTFKDGRYFDLRMMAVINPQERG